MASENRTWPPRSLRGIHALDEIDAAIVNVLQENAREAFAKIAARVNLSPTSVAERVRRLEDDGVITGYHANVAPARVGYPVTAFLLIQPNGPDARFAELAQSRPEIIECHRVTGHVSFIARAVLRDVKHLEEVIDDLARSSQIITLIVLSSPLDERRVPLTPSDARPRVAPQT